MLKQKLFLILSLILFCGAAAFAQAMSDEQVLQYVKDGMQQGKDQRQLATELARRGVTREQAERVKKLYADCRKYGGNGSGGRPSA